MDITEVNTDDEILLEFHFDRYGENIIKQKEDKKEFISKIVEILSENKKNNEWEIITLTEGAEFLYNNLIQLRND